jgi:YHS domain-containing protein
MITQEELFKQDKIFLVSPSRHSIIDGIYVYEVTPESVDKYTINGEPKEYYFTDREKAEEFARQENKRGYDADNDYHKLRNKYKEYEKALYEFYYLGGKRPEEL